VNDLLLSIIAVSLVLMAIVQVATLAYAARLARRVERVTRDLERDVRPLFADLRSMTADAARAMALTAGQVERAERLLVDVGSRLEQTFNQIQTRMLTPVREGAALLAGVRAALAAFRAIGEAAPAGRAPVDEEDALFIG
jgi:hypothetical protein